MIERAVLLDQSIDAQHPAIARNRECEQEGQVSADERATSGHR
jgi:hypothetical protein